MSIKLISRKAKIIEAFFLIILVISIFVSFFKPIQAGVGEIGIKAEQLAIGDRYFYISDEDPFAADSHFTFGGDKPLRGGPLYPNILKGISFISIKLFK